MTIFFATLVWKKQTGEDMPSGILIGFRQCGSAYQSRSQNQELGFGQLLSLGEVLTGWALDGSGNRQTTDHLERQFVGATRTPNLSKLPLVSLMSRDPF
jgi:hypothetical protein